MVSVGDLLRGIVVETKTQSWTGGLINSDRACPEERHDTAFPNKNHMNEWASIPVLGIAAGITRMALSVIHTIGHLFAALVTWDKGHLFHAAKGGCEFLRGFIESIPIAGRLFVNHYDEGGLWWIIKIYNPDHPDSLDRFTDHWAGLKQLRPSGYVLA